MKTPDATIDFDRLIRQYMENLSVTLRGFNPAEEFDFLATFVPAEDPTDSLLELIELARDGGLHRLTVTLTPATLAKIDTAKLSKFARAPLADRIELTFTFEPRP
jgi:hypothetical protein